jgi:hypothetical protein
MQNKELKTGMDLYTYPQVTPDWGALFISERSSSPLVLYTKCHIRPNYRQRQEMKLVLDLENSKKLL